MRSQSNILASITAYFPQSPALSCPSPGRFCQPSKLYLSFHPSCSSPSLAQTCPPPFCFAALSVSWSAGQAWSAYNFLIGPLISSISARGSSWLQMKWIWFGLWLRAKHLLRPEELIEEEDKARWNQMRWRADADDSRTICAFGLRQRMDGSSIERGHLTPTDFSVQAVTTPEPWFESVTWCNCCKYIKKKKSKVNWAQSF